MKSVKIQSYENEFDKTHGLPEMDRGMEIDSFRIKNQFQIEFTTKVLWKGPT